MGRSWSAEWSALSSHISRKLRILCLERTTIPPSLGADSRGWRTAFGELALNLDNDTNNASLVLTFEFVKKGEVLLFLGDAKTGNWSKTSACR